MSAITRKHVKPDQQSGSRAASKDIVARVPNGAARSSPKDDAQQRIRARAYEIYQTRRDNGGEGDAMSDWLQAERETNGTAPGLTATGIEVKTQARGEKLR